jgi:hypothetical protein
MTLDANRIILISTASDGPPLPGAREATVPQQIPLPSRITLTASLPLILTRRSAITKLVEDVSNETCGGKKSVKIETVQWPRLSNYIEMLRGKKWKANQIMNVG